RTSETVGSSGRRRHDPLALSLSKGEHVNDLEAPVARRHPEITRLVAALRKAGASHAAMTGSGSAVFGRFPTRSAAASASVRRAAGRLGAGVGRPGVGPRSREPGGLPPVGPWPVQPLKPYGETALVRRPSGPCRQLSPSYTLIVC